MIILHVIQDNKFYESTLNTMEADKEVENKVVLFTNTRDYSFKYIRDKIDLIKIIPLNRIWECVSFLRKENYDVIYFHSVAISLWFLFPFIPKDKIVAWWGWGYEMYGCPYGMRPLIEVNLYKDITKSLIYEEKASLLTRFKNCLLKHFFTAMRAKGLRRIDWFSPVVSYEMELMQGVKGFIAKEFYTPVTLKDDDYSVDEKKDSGNILIGNSSSHTNNHLDIWDKLGRLKITDRQIVLPLSYGEMDYKEKIKATMVSEKNEIVFLESFLPKDEYFKLFNSFSYAIYGVMRQQASENIDYCLLHGIKLFFFKDSIMYKYYKKNGFIVYTIEDDLNEAELSKCLTVEQNKHNVDCFLKDYSYRNKLYKYFKETIKK